MNSDIIDKIKLETPDMIKKIMKNDLVKILLYGSCARGDFRESSDVDIVLLTKGEREDNWKYNDRIDEAAPF